MTNEALPIVERLRAKRPEQRRVNNTATLYECMAHPSELQLEAADTIERLVAALEAFQHHVIRHSCVWDDAENGSHHHPIWQQVAEALASVRSV